jgi:hypothetical protein
MLGRPRSQRTGARLCLFRGGARPGARPIDAQLGRLGCRQRGHCYNAPTFAGVGDRQVIRVWEAYRGPQLGMAAPKFGGINPILPLQRIDRLRTRQYRLQPAGAAVQFKLACISTDNLRCYELSRATTHRWIDSPNPQSFLKAATSVADCAQIELKIA